MGHMQRMRLANRGRLLLRTTGPVPYETCICSNFETIHSWACRVIGPFEFRTSLGTSILLWAMPIYSDSLHWSDISLSLDLVTKLDLITNLYMITKSVYHRTFATVAASQQRTLTSPDTWSCPNRWNHSTHGNLILQKTFLHFRTRLKCDEEQICLCQVVDHT